MDIAQLRQVPVRVVKIQRRIWLLQVTFWFVLVVGGIAAVTAVARSIRRRRRATTVGTSQRPSTHGTNGAGAAQGPDV
jgi:hypothetical protein